MKLYDVIQKEYPHHKEDVLVQDESSQQHHVKKPSPRDTRKRIIFFGSLLLILAVIYSLGVRFVRARIVVEERVIPFTLTNTTLTLPHETETDPERLSFQTMKVSTEITREIFGSEFKEVTGKATGSVIFFNEFSTSSQTIKTGTRLVSDAGKTYITQATISIPGYKIDSKTKKKTPGTSNPVPVVAVDVGASYNTQGTALSVSSFSGTKRKQLYARSAGAFTGGEAGTMHTVSAQEREKVIETLKTQLAERLRRETRAQIPEHLVTYPELQFITIDTDSLRLVGEGVKFPARLSGSMVSYLIPRDLLQQAIATDVLRDTQYPSVIIPELQTLEVLPVSPIPTNSDTPPQSIEIEISGEGTIIAQVTPERIRSLLVGARKGSFMQAIATIPEIQSAQSSLYPFWAPYFPKEEKYIYIDFK